MVKDLIIIGAGNPDIIRLIEDVNSESKKFNLLGFLEKDTKLFNTNFGDYPILGGDEILDNKALSKALIVNNIYSNQQIRKVTSDKFNIYKNRFCNLIHPSAHLGNIKIGVGNIIYDRVIIQSGSVVGNHNVIHSASIICHETKVGNNCLISVNVTIGSRSQVGDFCFYGIASCSLPHLIICDFVFIGGGAVVFNNVKEPCSLFGNPARLLPKSMN